MNKALQRFTNYICELSDEEDKEVFLYGLEAIVSTIECLGLSFLVCCMLGEAFFGFFFILLLSLIKVRFTVYHCKTRLGCAISYLCLVLLNLWYFQYVHFTSLFVLFIITCSIILKRRSEITRGVIVIWMLYYIVYFYGIKSIQVVVFQVFLTLLIVMIEKDLPKRMR